jgi:hypothetical protein
LHGIDEGSFKASEFYSNFLLERYYFEDVELKFAVSGNSAGKIKERYRVASIPLYIT